MLQKKHEKRERQEKNDKHDAMNAKRKQCCNCDTQHGINTLCDRNYHVRVRIVHVPSAISHWTYGVWHVHHAAPINHIA